MFLNTVLHPEAIAATRMTAVSKVNSFKNLLCFILLFLSCWSVHKNAYTVVDLLKICCGFSFGEGIWYNFRREGYGMPYPQMTTEKGKQQ